MTSPAPTHLLLVRHAETAQNAGGFVQGRADHPLSERGQLQAEALGQALASMTLAAVYSSPLARARATAEAIARPHGLSVRCDPDLIEMEIGAFEGLSGPEMRARYPEFFADWFSERAGSVRMPGGESLEDVQARARAALMRIMAAHPGETVAVVSHNFLLLCLLCYVLHLPLFRFRQVRLHVASVSQIEAQGDILRIGYLNDVCHLERAGLLSADPWQPRR